MSELAKDITPKTTHNRAVSTSVKNNSETKLPAIFNKLGTTSTYSQAIQGPSPVKKDKRSRFQDTASLYLEETHAQRLGRNTPGLKYNPSTENLIGKNSSVHGFIREPTYKLGTEKRPDILETVKKVSHGAPIGAYNPSVPEDKWQAKGAGSFGKHGRVLEFPVGNGISKKK